QNGYYEYSYIKPPPSKPWLEASPKVKVVGEPLGPPLVGTTRAFFTVDIAIKNITAENDLIGVQNIAFQFPRDIITINNPADPSLNVTEGTFMNNPLWAPYGTTFIYVIDWDYPPEYNTISIGLIINPNPDTSEYDWPERPFGDGILCTIYFEVIYQEALPWEGHTTLDIEPLFPGEMFLNSTEGWIEYLPPVDGEIIVKGYVVGRMIDVYVGNNPDEPYPYPLGGQGPNATADMFWPQKKIYIWAFVSYNFWPEQNKVVTFEIRDPDWNIVTVLSGVTDENGIARASFRIPWPEHEKYLCHEYTIIASVDIACEKVWDWLWFHFDYLVRWEKFTVEPEEIGHCGYVTITLTIKSKAMQYYDVLITIDLKDELQYPIGFDMTWVRIGGAEYCHYKESDPIEFTFHIGKHAHAGIATIHVNALSALPSLCGYAWCPEYVDPQTGETPTFFILAKWA
ncbi:MAG: hypothetical protein QHH17_03295, partial [Candidatus Bathyarchaeota archaeon]|nr:hypothetical protein [Candidatus Bathyarchaeota archaeon]